MARDFLYRMARCWVSEYHIDGFRIDEFKSINNYDFVQEFTEQATREQRVLFPAMWDFNYRDEVRRLLTSQISTSWGQPSRRERVAAKMSDPVDLQRAQRPLHAQLRRQVTELLQLRNTRPALQHAEVDHFYFHP